MNMFERASHSLRKSPAILLIFAVFVVLAVIGLGLAITDYETNLAGYQLLPTNKVNDWSPYLVALIPQIGQVAFIWIYAQDTKRRWAIVTAIILHLVDLATDVLFKAVSFTPLNLTIAILESELIYTLGSHLTLSVSLGMIFGMWPDVTRHLKRELVHEDLDDDDDEDDDPRFSQRPAIIHGPGAGTTANPSASRMFGKRP